MYAAISLLDLWLNTYKPCMNYGSCTSGCSPQYTFSCAWRKDDPPPPFNHVTSIAHWGYLVPVGNELIYNIIICFTRNVASRVKQCRTVDPFCKHQVNLLMDFHWLLSFILQGRRKIKTCVWMEAEEGIHWHTSYNPMAGRRGKESHCCSSLPSVCSSALLPTKETGALHKDSEYIIETTLLQT